MVRSRLPKPVGGYIGIIAKALLALSKSILRPLALSQIEHKGDALVSAFAEGSRTCKHGHAAAVFPEELLLVRFADSGCHKLCHDPFVSGAPFSGRQPRPAHAPRAEIIATVSNHAEK